MSKIIELKPKKELINSNFEGYKLSLEQIPNTNYGLPGGVHKLEQIGDTFSYLYVVLFSMHNHLIVDPWNENDLYFINQNRTITMIVNPAAQEPDSDYFIKMLQIPAYESVEHSYNMNLIFASDSTAVISTGTGILHIINTGVRGCSQNWTIEGTIEVLDRPFTLLDARIQLEDSSIQFHCLLSSILERKSDDEDAKFPKTYTNLHWMVIKKNGNDWIIENDFEFSSSGAVRCGYFTPNGENLFIESNKPVDLPKSTNNVTEIEKSEKTEPKYYWQQTTDDIKIWIALPSGCIKDDVKVEIVDLHINVSIKNATYLSGSIFQRLNSELTTWNISNNRLEIILSKCEDGLMWRYLIENDDKGEELVDSELVEEVHKRLAHLCSETEAVSDNTVPSFNPGQLEACDNAPDEDSRLIMINHSTKTLSNEANLTGHQKLFNIRLNENCAAICIRHDVDGMVWKLDDSKVYDHIGTLNAFGYILASKEWKYCTCSPDLSYAVIAATKQNVFIYKQKCEIGSDLRNRKTGQKFNHVGKQYLISLTSSDEILGIQATNDYLFVLTKQMISTYYIKDID